MNRTIYITLIIIPAVLNGILYRYNPNLAINSFLGILIFYHVIGFFRMKYLKFDNKSILKSYIPFSGFKTRLEKLTQK